jgi:hypothetical protein
MCDEEDLDGLVDAGAWDGGFTEADGEVVVGE